MSTARFDKYRDELHQQNISELSSTLTDIFAVRIFCTECDVYLQNINSGKTSDLIPFFSCLKALWHRMRVIVFAEIRENYDKRMEKAEEYIIVLKRRLERGLPVRPSYEKIKEIEELYQDILMIKQRAGLGFSIRKEKTYDERLKNVMLT